MKEEQNFIKSLVAVFFVITGATGLIYQIVWFKYLALFLGNTTYAQMIVLSTFLGGLALGNYLFGKRADTINKPLQLYAVLEIFIGIYCLLYPLISGWLGNVFLKTASNYGFDGTDYLFNVFRFITSALLLILPTTAMGGTLPLLSKYFVEKLENTRKDVGALYFLNSFGAVWGIILSGFVLIPAFGLPTSIYIAAIINLFVGVAALSISYYSKHIDSQNKIVVDSNDADEPAEINPEVYKSTTIRKLILIAGISGMAALLYEMVWTRMLVTIFGSSTYAFSLMLMAFISGITIGSFIISQKFIARYNKIKLLALFQIAIALSTMIILLFYERLPYVLWKISSYFNKTNETFALFLTIEFALCFIVLIIPTLFMGMTLPLIVDIAANHSKKVAFSVGKVFSVNTLGTVIGVIFTGLIFIPFLGIKNTFEIGIALNLIACVIVLFESASIELFKKLTYGSIIISVYALYIIAAPNWDLNISIGGVFRSLKENVPGSFEEYRASINQYKVLFYKEGVNANVSVSLTPPPLMQKRLVINGKPDASSISDMPTQKLLAQIPMILQNDPKNIFVVGFGSGATIGSVLTHNVSRVDCAEISAEVIEAGKYFKEENNNCLEDKRLKIFNEDALTILKLSKKKYDVIISEPSNPWIAGIGNLFSEEYFSLCKSKLSKGGIMVQWFHMYEANDEIVKLVLNTFRSVFPNVSVWNGVANDFIIVGTAEEYIPHFEMMKNKIKHPSVKNDLKSIGIENLFTFLSCQSLSSKGVFLISDLKAVNSELHPLLEFMAPKSFYTGETSTLIYRYDEKFDLLDHKLLAQKYIQSNEVGYQELSQASRYHFNVTKNYRLVYGITNYLLTKKTANYSDQMLMINSITALRIEDPWRNYYNTMIEQYKDSVYLKRALLNSTINQKINSTNFIWTNSIKSESEKFIELSDTSMKSRAKLFVQLASNYLKNYELKEADFLCVKVEEFIKKDAAIKKYISMDDYYYIRSILAIYSGDHQRAFENYLAITQINSRSQHLPYLRRIVEYKLSEANQYAKINVN